MKELARMHVTVAICTWNRADLLKKTLGAMRNLLIPPGLSWELIVVNNASTDHTEQVLAEFADQFPLRHVRESRQGHCHARNRAIAEATGDLIIWTDDDVLVEPDWLVEYCAAAERFPDATFFGGRVDPLYEVEPPDWVEDGLSLLTGPYALCRYDGPVRPFSSEEAPVGASMAFRLAALRHHLFDTRLGRVGDDLISGDDTEMIQRMRRCGLWGVWVGTARVRHWVPQARMTHQYVWDWFYGAGATFVRQVGAIPGKRLFGLPRWVVRQYLQFRCTWALRALFRRRTKVVALRGWAFNAGVLAAVRRESKAARLAGPTCQVPA